MVREAREVGERDNRCERGTERNAKVISKAKITCKIKCHRGKQNQNQKVVKAKSTQNIINDTQ